MKKSQVTLTVRLKAKPAMGTRLEEIARGLLTPTRQEPGCIDYYFHVNSKTPNEFFFYENWIDQESLDKHANMPYIKEFQKAIAPLLAEDPEFVMWNITE